MELCRRNLSECTLDRVSGSTNAAVEGEVCKENTCWARKDYEKRTKFDVTLVL